MYPNCGSPLVIRKGRYGEFVACSNYPECKYIKKEEVEEIDICDCPKCEGKIVEKKSTKKFNFRFFMLETTQYNYKDMSKMYKDLTANEAKYLFRW